MDVNFDEDDRITMNRAARTARSRRRMDNVRRRTVPDEECLLEDNLAQIRPASSISADVIGGVINTDGQFDSNEDMIKQDRGLSDVDNNEDSQQIQNENVKDVNEDKEVSVTHSGNRYMMKKTAIQGLMTLALLINTYTQIKNLVLTGTRHKFYYIVLLVNVLLLTGQLVVGIILIVILRIEASGKKKEEEQYIDYLNDIIIFLITAVIVLNISLSTFSVLVYDS